MIDAGEALPDASLDKQVVNKALMESGKWEIEIGARRYPCVVSARPLYDPNNQRIKGL